MFISSISALIKRPYMLTSCDIGPGRTSTPVPGGKPGAYPTHAEVHAAIPSTGVSSSHLLQIFRHRLGENHKRFIGIVKEVSIYGADKLLRPRPWKDEWN